MAEPRPAREHPVAAEPVARVRDVRYERRARVRREPAARDELVGDGRVAEPAVQVAAEHDVVVGRAVVAGVAVVVGRVARAARAGGPRRHPRARARAPRARARRRRGRARSAGAGTRAACAPARRAAA